MGEAMITVLLAAARRGEPTTPACEAALLQSEYRAPRPLARWALSCRAGLFTISPHWRLGAPDRTLVPAVGCLDRFCR